MADFVTPIGASYMRIATHQVESYHQLEVGSDIIVDLDKDGRVLGVERIGGPVDLGTLVDVLRAVKVAADG